MGFPVDVEVTGGGSVFIFNVLTPSARLWVEENVAKGDWNPDFPNSIVVEHRYARDLAAGMEAAGLVVV